MRASLQTAAAALLLALGAGAAAAAGADGKTGAPFIAGTTPSQRPDGAPAITEMTKDAAWYAQALTGVEQPYPASLRFLEDQGAWFDPFIRPGMTGPYDIRHWHDGN